MCEPASVCVCGRECGLYGGSVPLKSFFFSCFFSQNFFFLQTATPISSRHSVIVFQDGRSRIPNVPNLITRQNLVNVQECRNCPVAIQDDKSFLNKSCFRFLFREFTSCFRKRPRGAYCVPWGSKDVFSKGNKTSNN